MEIRSDSPFVQQPKEIQTQPLTPRDVNRSDLLGVSKTISGSVPTPTYLQGETAFLQLAISSEPNNQLDLQAIEHSVAEDGPGPALNKLFESLQVHRDFDAADAIMQTCPSLKAVINLPNMDGDTLWMRSVCLGDLSMIDWLESHNAKPSITDGNGRTGLMRMMIEVEHPEVLKHLLNKTLHGEKGFDINEKDYTGLTAVAYAAFTGRLDDVNLLLTRGASLKETLKDLPLDDEVQEDLLRSLSEGEPFNPQDLNALMDAIEQKLAEKLFTDLSEPVADDVYNELDAFRKIAPKIDLSKADQHTVEELQNTRTSGSGTLTQKNLTPLEQEACQEARKAWNDCDAWIRKKALTKESLTEQDIHIINEMVNRNEGAGVLRTEMDITAGGRVTCVYLPAREVEHYFQQFCQMLQDGIKACEKESHNPIALASWAYQMLVSIHPYNDANGRTCRMVADYILQRFELPPMALGRDVDVASFALLESRSVTPTDAAEKILDGVKNSYRILGYNV